MTRHRVPTHSGFESWKLRAESVHRIDLSKDSEPEKAWAYLCRCYNRTDLFCYRCCGRRIAEKVLGPGEHCNARLPDCWGNRKGSRKVLRRVWKDVEEFVRNGNTFAKEARKKGIDIVIEGVL